ncbi:cytochrome P450 [Paracoccus sp. S3-43]|uniref:cytochrome P450 n=1 Tax=Paracoccus sp. S3-43 TaxID=3030011 RepID=UPI0023B0455B|nr:cytochrome P450 [Paracoccus sp. S3-43]WEF25985.1 cytochrome P450 [Paracoccus sp. S3-43]
MVARLRPGEQDIEPEASFAAADVVFRALFSMPIEHATAARVFAALPAHQDAQPVVNLAALLPWPHRLPHPHSRRTRRSASEIRGLIAGLVADRMAAIRDDTAPDPQTGRRFSEPQMVDQVAIFFLAGHETSPSALAWALRLLAAHPAGRRPSPRKPPP